MMEWLGIIWLLDAVYMWSYYHQRIIAPWPQWTVFPFAYPLHWLGIAIIAGLTGLIFG